MIFDFFVMEIGKNNKGIFLENRDSMEFIESANIKSDDFCITRSADSLIQRKKIEKQRENNNFYRGSNENDKGKERLFPLGVFVFFLTALQLARIKMGPMPLYFSEILAAILILKTFSHSKLHWSNYSKIILFVSVIYFVSVIFGEIRGAISYHFILPALFQIFRYSIGIFLVFAIPRLIRTNRHFQGLLKAAVLGMLITGSLSIFSSLSPTRPIAKIIFSNSLLESVGKHRLEKNSTFREESAIRGTSMIGPATMTGAYLCILWPLGLLAYRRIDSNTKWKTLCLLACIIAPIGSLVTYGRTAWLGVFTTVGLMGLFGSSGMRRIIIPFVAVVIIIVSHIGLQSKYFYIERIANRTAATFNDPMASADVTERFLSYIEPFEHLYENPSWLFAGAGSAGDKMVDRRELDSLIYAQGPLATHSAFAWAYYGYGVLGALCHILLMLSSLALILRNLLSTKRTEPEERLIWQTLFAVWLGGLVPWWLFGHAAVSTARGNMFFFFIFSIFLTCEQLRLNSQSSI